MANATMNGSKKKSRRQSDASGEKGEEIKSPKRKQFGYNLKKRRIM